MEPASVSPTARPEVLQSLREDLETPRHASDGGGRAWLDPTDGDTEAVAGQPGRWTVVYEAGELGIAEGGMLFFQVPPFWGWSTPQTRTPEASGFTEVVAEPAREGFEVQTVDRGLMAIRFVEGGLAPGHRIRIRYGAGTVGAIADRYAERASPFWIGVDGDGDGVRGLVPDAPTVDVLPGPAARLELTLPSVAAPGSEVELRLAVLDRVGNGGVPYRGELQLTVIGEAEVPGRVTIPSSAEGRIAVPVQLPRANSSASPGSVPVVRVTAAGPGGLVGTSNPLRVSARHSRILWADLHGHSALSDGTGTPEDYLSYAREIAALDVVALTDHDHWGMEPLSERPDLWGRIERATAAAHEPGRFVTLLGYEWTSWVHGHRHVLYFDDTGEVLSSVDPAYEHPRQLWDALRGKDALTFAHHSAGGPVATDWNVAPDPVLEPITEVVSVHGSSEAADSPAAIYSAVAGNFVRDALDRGYRLGFVGSGDSHDGHPGLSHLAAPSGGLAAILAPEATRDAVLTALRARRTYATNGPRILLDVDLDGAVMGSELEPSESRGALSVEVVGTAVIARVDVVRTGRVSVSVEGDGSARLAVELELPPLAAGEYLYVRAVQEDGGAAWSSPFFVSAERP